MKEVLLNNGYKQFKPNSAIDKCNMLYQKKTNGYYINIRYWDFSNYGYHNKDGWSAKVQFNSCSDPTFNVELLDVNTMTIQEIESFFESIALGMDVQRISDEDNSPLNVKILEEE